MVFSIRKIGPLAVQNSYSDYPWQPKFKIKDYSFYRSWLRIWSERHVRPRKEEPYSLVVVNSEGGVGIC